MRFVPAPCAWPPAQGPTAGHSQTGQGARWLWVCPGACACVCVHMAICVCVCVLGLGGNNLISWLELRCCFFSVRDRVMRFSTGTGLHVCSPEREVLSSIKCIFFQATVHDIWRRIVFLLFVCREIKMSYKLTSFKQAISSKRIIKIPLTCIWPLRWNVAVAAQASDAQGAPTLGRAGDW